MGSASPPFDQIVFSGGGCRCFWQGGFLHVARDRLVPDPKRISAVSGGALSAAGFIARRGETIKSLMQQAFSEQDSNLSLNDLREGEGLTPHQSIYRDVVTEAFAEGAEQAVAEGPAFQVLLGHPPTGTLGSWTGTAAALAYEAELHLVSGPHFGWAEKIGMTSSLVDAREAARRGKLVDLICAAAVIPPLFDLAEWEGRPVIDGGMADQAPMPDPDEGPTLILLTRTYRRIPEHRDRLYIGPRSEVEIEKIDFTDPDKIARTWDQGVEDAKQMMPNWA